MKVIVRVSIGDLMLRNSEIDTLEVTQALGEHATCRIEFTRDSSSTVSLDQVLRDPVSVHVQQEGGPVVELFQGYIGDGVQTHLLHAGARFSLTATSPSERLDFVDTVFHPQATLASVAGKLGVAIKGTPRREHAAFDYVQWAESEFTFLRRIADEQGGFLVTHLAEPEIRTEFLDTGVELNWGQDLLEVSTRAQPVNHGLTGASYDMRQKSTHAHAGIRQAPGGLGGAARMVATVAELADEASGGGDPGVHLASAREQTHAELKTALKRESERALGAAVRIEGTSVNTRVAAGELVTLVSGTNYVLPTVGRLGVVRVVHTFADQHYSNAFVATPWKGFTALESFEGPRLPGPVTAEVIDNLDPDGMGRVRVAYRWQAETPVTSWARLATPHAGNGRGMLWLPEVGDEVLVAFESGDPEAPVVLGAMWNGRDRVPEVPKDNLAKRFITRSGNTIQLLDEGGSETIEVFTPEGKALIQLTNAGGSPVITIKSAGDIALEAAKELRITCQSFVQKVDGKSARTVSGDEVASVSGNVTIKAGGNATFNGLNTAIGAGAMLDATAGGIINIAGSLVNLQPPGFVAKPVVVPPVVIKELEVGQRQVPGEASPQRTADPDTPRGKAT